jgi:hypothetical protein
VKAIPAEFQLPSGLRPHNLDDRRALSATVASALVMVIKLTEQYAQLLSRLNYCSLAGVFRLQP